MKKQRNKLLIIFLISMCITLSVIASATTAKLSPALDFISNEHTMVKAGDADGIVCFSKQDFYNHIGLEGTSIKITSLPEENEGTLMLGLTKVSLGQNISWGNLDLLRFETNSSIKECSFKFTLDGSYTTECMIKITELSGAAPTTEIGGIKTVTHSDISCHGLLQAEDVDGDIKLFEVTAYPSYGIVTLTDSKNGEFIYTPYEGYVGVDSFVYRVRDEMGNYSEECQVSIEVLEDDHAIVLSDMTDNYAHSAAITAVSEGYMECISENGALYFDPNETLTREEFLYAVMDALGAPTLSCTNTVFADNDDITEKYRGYVSAAYKLGVVKGKDSDKGLLFSPGEAITQAEAAVILNRILGAQAESTIPHSWASQHVSALARLGIISNTDSLTLDSYLTKAEAAQMLFITKNIYS